MSRSHELRFPPLMIYGRGALERAGETARRHGTRALVVCGRTVTRGAGLAQRLGEVLAAAGVEAPIFDQVEPEPSSATVDACVEAVRAAGAQVVMGIGGGSPLDVGKAAAGIITLGGKTERYLPPESKPIDRPALPFIGLPTTAGTAAEITQNAVIYSPSLNAKIGLRSPFWVPAAAIVDPALTDSMPPDLTARTGADALTHALEGYVSRRATPVTDALALKAIELVGAWLARAVRDGGDTEARDGMALASMTAGMAFANTGVGAAHSIGHPLGALHHLPHGTACALLLPYVMEYNLEAAGEKFTQVARALQPGREQPTPADGVRAVRELLRGIGLPLTLAEVGVRREDLSAMVPGTMLSGSLKTNPRAVTEQDALQLLEKAWVGGE
jgi:alcohol dehydrogenase class IV